MRRSLPSALRVAGLCVLTSVLAACGGTKPVAPPQATVALALNHPSAPAGSPLDLTFSFTVAPEASFTENYRVFVHVVDADGETLWNDDHEPAVPTTSWKAGSTVTYTRSVFVPVVPYVGTATVQVGLYSPATQTRVTLAGGQDLGLQSYAVATLELLPQTDNLFTVFKDGWQMAETAPHDPAVEWQWTKGHATLAFRNPKKNAVLFLEYDSPQRALHGVQHVEVSLGGTVIDRFDVEPDAAPQKRRVALDAAQMGSDELTELQFAVDAPFVPAQVTGGSSGDQRELGIRVFHAFVDPR